MGWNTATDAMGDAVTGSTICEATGGTQTLYAHWAEDHTHKLHPGAEAATTFATPLDRSSFPSNLAAGKYYLTEDITTSSQITVSGTVDLCLNGHTITSTYDSTKGAFSLDSDCTLSICDCKGATALAPFLSV